MASNKKTKAAGKGKTAAKTTAKAAAAEIAAPAEGATLAPSNTPLEVTHKGVCDRGDDLDVGRVVLSATDASVFDFYLCRMSGDVDIELSAAGDQPFQTLKVHTEGQSHTGLQIPVATMPAGLYSLAWQFNGMRPEDWSSCAEFTKNDSVIFRQRREEKSRPPKTFGALVLKVQ